MLAIVNPLGHSSAVINLEYNFTHFNIENVLSDVAEVIDNVTNSQIIVFIIV